MVNSILGSEILQQVVNTNCAGASLTNIQNLCYNTSKIVEVSNIEDNTTTWQTSSNVSIVAQSNSAITIKAINASVNGEGWVKATLSNGVVLQEEFWVGRPSTEKISIIKSGAVRLTENTWNIIHIIYDNKFPHLIQGVELTDWEWRMFPSPGTSIMSRLGTGTMILLRPTTHNGYVDFQSRVCNECGYSGWKSKIFQIGNSGVEPGSPPGFEW